MPNWVVWDSLAHGCSGWEDSWTDCCGYVGFETLQEAWHYYKTHQGLDALGYSGMPIPQWCTLPKSVIVHPELRVN